MKTLYLDMVGGIAGDMLLGLLIDLGLEQTDLELTLKQLPIDGWRLQVNREQRLGITGTRLQVILTGAEQPRRRWREIDALIAGTNLSSSVKTKAREVFRQMGKAEAKVHGKPIEDIHFHEVGAVDAIIDIVGSVYGLERLGIEQLVGGTAPLGFGSCQTAHGNYPLPAPATVELLGGWPVRDAACDKELVTPTGAALLATLATSAPLPEMQLKRTAYGIGGWELPDRPNLIRGLLGETDSATLNRDSVVVLETHIDDADPETLGFLMERLLEAGALDVGFSPLQMKKNRPGCRITVISPPLNEATLAHLVLRETGSGGVRTQIVQRYKFQRRLEKIETEFGPVTIKLFFDGENLSHATPEYDECCNLAREKSLPFPEVQRRIRNAIDAHFFLPTDTP
ncbi:MAG: TIGR00299 family protein [Desulfuromonas sp.]|nr:MAG: TIGR00299 family protein [Desulfuromonas sp.]